MAFDVQTQQNHHHHHHQGQVHGSKGTSSGSSLVTTHQTIPVTLDFFYNYNLPCSYTQLAEPPPLPVAVSWQDFLNLKKEQIFYTETTEKMSRRNGNGPKLDLKLNLSPPRANHSRAVQSPSRSETVSPTSPPSSCVSSENQEDNLRYSNSPEATSMVLVGCPRCLMYVMLSEDDPKCPKCKSTVLLDFLQDNNNNNNTTMKTRRN